MSDGDSVEGTGSAVSSRDCKSVGGKDGQSETEGSRFEIVAREDFSDATYLIEFRHPMMARRAKPGQG